jgi:aromatic ring-cleaving dioxygenase
VGSLTLAEQALARQVHPVSVSNANDQKEDAMYWGGGIIGLILLILLILLLTGNL